MTLNIGHYGTGPCRGLLPLQDDSKFDSRNK